MRLLRRWAAAISESNLNGELLRRCTRILSGSGDPVFVIFTFKDYAVALRERSGSRLNGGPQRSIGGDGIKLSSRP